MDWGNITYSSQIFKFVKKDDDHCKILQIVCIILTIEYLYKKIIEVKHSVFVWNNSDIVTTLPEQTDFDLTKLKT